MFGEIRRRWFVTPLDHHVLDEARQEVTYGEFGIIGW